MTDTTPYDQILTHWHLEFLRSRPDIVIAGSPERTAYRTVVEDTAGSRWLLEKIFDQQRKHKLAIIELLNQLDAAGYPYAVPYLQAPNGSFQVEVASDYWQIVPFVDGADLDRPAYAFDEWRSFHIAKGLIDLKRSGMSDQVGVSDHLFSIVDYIPELIDTILAYNPELLEPLKPIVEYLKRTLFPLHDSLPTRLCHGDYHPVNIIWGERDILAVIDWEFFGVKPEAYDLANMLGCLGMEDPGALYGPLVMDLLETLRSATYLTEESWASLLDLVLAIRFGWMSEWLRKKDTEMIRLELTYMYLIMDHHDDIQKKWHLA